MSRKFQMEIQRFHELTTAGNTLVLSCTEAGGGAIPILESGAIATGTSATTTATIVTVNPHGYTTGASVIISGVTPVGYNGTYTITVTNPTTFTYTFGDIANASIDVPGLVTSASPAVYLLAGGTALENVVTYTNSNTAFVGPTFEIRDTLFSNTNIITLGFTTIYDSSANTSTSTRYMTIKKTDEPPRDTQSFISGGQKESEVQTTRKKYAPIIIDTTAP